MLCVRQIRAVMLVLACSCFASSINAQPFHTRLDVMQSESTFRSALQEKYQSDAQLFGLTYYLRPVVIAAGPLGERVFLSKSAYVAGTYGKSTPVPGATSDILGFGARLVNATNSVFGLSYETMDTDLTNREDKDMTVELGKFLGNRGLAVISYETSESTIDIDTETWTMNYRQLFDGGLTNRYLAYEFALDYIDTDISSGYQLSLSNTQYFSNYLSIGAFVSYLDVGNVSTSRASLNSEFYFTEMLSGEVQVTRTDNSGEQEVDTIDLKISARF